MKNILEQQDDLKGYQDEALKRELQQPTGVAPSFLIMSELGRREEMRKKYQMEQAKETKTSMAEEMAAPPRQGMPTQHQAPRGGGIGNVPPPSPSGIQGYAGGGMVERYRHGGTIGYQRGGRVLPESAYRFMQDPFPWDKIPRPNTLRMLEHMTRDKPLTEYEQLREGDRQFYEDEQAIPSTGEVTSISDIQMEPTATPVPSRESVSVSAPVQSQDVFDRFNVADRPQIDRADTSPILEMLDDLERTKANSRGAALLKMGASMMANTGNIGQAMGEGLAAGLTEYQSNEALNRDIDMARMKGMTQLEAIKSADSRAQYQGDVSILQSMISSDGAFRSAMMRASKASGLTQAELTEMILKEKKDNMAEKQYDVTDVPGASRVLAEAAETVFAAATHAAGGGRGHFE